MKKRILSLCLVIVMALGSVLLVACKPLEDMKPTYTLTVENGTGSGTYLAETMVTVVANEGDSFMSFEGWKVGEEVVSTDKTYSFKLINNLKLVACFGYTPSCWDGNYPETAPASFVISESVASTDLVTEKTVSGAAVPEGTVYRDATIDINDAAALAWFESTCSSVPTDPNGAFFLGYFRSEFTNWTRYTVNLNCDVDMQGFEWKGFDAEKPILHGVTFNGNGHTILNMYCIGKAVHIDGYRGWGAGGFINILGGGSQVVIKDLNFTNACVVGSSGQIGVVIGGYYNADVTLDNVNVYDSVVNAAVGSKCGHKAGLLIGRIGNNESNGDQEIITIKNCLVQDSTVIGARNVGALVGAIFSARATYITWKWTNIGMNCYEGFFTGKVTALKNELTALQAATPINQAAIDAKITEIQQWEGFVADFDAHTYKLNLENNIINGCQVITTATSYQNTGIAYNLGKSYFTHTLNGGNCGFYNTCKAYDNTTIESFSNVEGVQVKGFNTIINMKNFVNYDGKHKPLYVGSAGQFAAVLESYNVADDRTPEGNGYGAVPFYVFYDIDLTEVIASNEAYAGIVFDPDVRIYLVNGAKITGIPEGMLTPEQIVAIDYGFIGNNA